MNDLIDHTYLKPNCTDADIDRLCAEARDNGFFAVCVPPYFVSRAVQRLEGSGVRVATVVGFPFGYGVTATKVTELQRALEEGADEVDIVINLAAVKSGDWAYVRADMDRTVTAARLRGRTSKLIIEAAALTGAERDRIAELCNELRPDFVKTSTGLLGGATVEDVRYLRDRLDADIRIKASGGIRTAGEARSLVEAGADRLGTSAGLAVVQ